MKIMRRPLARGLVFPALTLLAWTLAGSAHAQWVWRDATGHTVFSDSPPPPNISQTSILRQPAGAVESISTRDSAGGGPTYDTSGQAPSAAQGIPNGANRPANAEAQVKSPAAPAKKTLAEQDADFRKRQEDRVKAEQKAAEEEQKTAQHAASCEQAKSYLQMLQDGTRLMRPDAQGNRNFLDDDQRSAEIQKAQDSVASNC